MSMTFAKTLMTLACAGVLGMALAPAAFADEINGDGEATPAAVASDAQLQDGEAAPSVDVRQQDEEAVSAADAQQGGEAISVADGQLQDAVVYVIVGDDAEYAPEGQMQAQADDGLAAPDDTYILSGDVDYDAARAVVTLVNKERAAQGLQPITMDAELTEAAMRRALEVGLYFDHKRPDGTNFWVLTSKARGENIAAGAPTPEYVMTGWMNSSGHRANILASSWKSIGVGCYRGDGATYWVQIFGDQAASGSIPTGTKAKTYETGIDYDIIQFDDSTAGFNLDYSLDRLVQLPEGDTVELCANIVNTEFPSDVCYLDPAGLTWESSDPSVATVSAKGVVTGKKIGEATITATTPGGKVFIQDFAVKRAKKAATKWTRLSGGIALDTMSSIVDKGNFPKGGTVVLTTVGGYWDALAGAGVAGLTGAPVLMTDGQTLSPQTRAQIAKLAPKTVIVCGGSAAVSDKVMNDAVKAAGAGAKGERLWGANAIKTAEDIYAKGATFATDGPVWSDSAFICTSNGYWDALSAAPISYALHMPILLTQADGIITQGTIDAMKKGGITSVYIVGGTAAVPEATADALRAAGIAVADRFAGWDALATSAYVAEFGMSMGMSADLMGIATNGGYWDALAGAPLCGKNGAVLVLVGDAWSFTVTDYVPMRSSLIIEGYIFGGTAAVSGDVESALKAGTQSL